MWKANSALGEWKPASCEEGGFVPVGIKERADDVPAMLSKNEFVMTADAVRGIGNGSVEEGSKKLYNTMKQAEKVGKA